MKNKRIYAPDPDRYNVIISMDNFYPKITIIPLLNKNMWDYYYVDSEGFRNGPFTKENVTLQEFQDLINDFHPPLSKEEYILSELKDKIQLHTENINELLEEIKFEKKSIQKYKDKILNVKESLKELLNNN